MLKIFKQTKTNLIPFAYEYFLSIPTDYDKDVNKHWPLLLFLHGAGERFPPIEKILNHGPPKLIHSYVKANSANDKNINMETAKFLTENFLTCSPQVPEGYGWNTQVLINLLDQLEEKYRINKQRIYCTGMSMGKRLIFKYFAHIYI